MRLTNSFRRATAVAGLAAVFPATATASPVSEPPHAAANRTPSSCPDYTHYAQKPHEPFSSGPLKLPYMRPSEECRTFKSPAVEVSQSVYRREAILESGLLERVHQESGF